MVIFIQYLYWHYFIAPREILGIGRNYQVSVWHRFLIGRHLATLLSPWHRMSAMLAARHPTIQARLEAFFLEPVLRLIGLIIRLAVICTGLAIEACVTLTIALGLILWFAWPALLLISLFTGFRMILTS